LINQRARWINTWFKYFKFGFGLIYRGLRNFSKNQFLFGLVLLRPPLFIFLLLSTFCAVANLWINPAYTMIWLAGFACFILSFFIALIRSKADIRIYKALLGIPKFMFYQVFSLLKMGKANERSVATNHYYHAAIDDVMHNKV